MSIEILDTHGVLQLGASEFLFDVEDLIGAHGVYDENSKTEIIIGYDSIAKAYDDVACSIRE